MEAMPKGNIRLRSFSGTGWYTVSLSDWTCDCAAFRMLPGPPCKHLNALGIYNERKPFVASAHPTFSQGSSGLVKSLRLRRIDDAVYWLMYLYRLKHMASRFLVARRLLIGSAS